MLRIVNRFSQNYSTQPFNYDDQTILDHSHRHDLRCSPRESAQCSTCTRLPLSPPPFFFTLPPTSPPQIPPNSLFSRSLALTTRQPVCIRSCTTLSLHILLHTLVCTHTLTGQLPKSHIHTRTTQDVQSSSELYAIFFPASCFTFRKFTLFFLSSFLSSVRILFPRVSFFFLLLVVVILRFFFFLFAH